jgi:uncharacterized phage protein (TIGR02220 family)
MNQDKLNQFIILNQISNQETISHLQKFILFCQQSNNQAITEIINHLNTTTNSKFLPNTSQTTKLLNKIIPKYPIEQIKQAISLKAEQWLDNPKMNKYLRPQTLFAEANIEAYINELSKNTPKQHHHNISNFTSHQNPKYNQYVLSQKAQNLNWLTLADWIKLNP